MRKGLEKFIRPSGLKTEDIDARAITLVNRFVRIISYAVIAISLAVLAGWQFDINLLRALSPRFPGMNPFVALSFIAVSVWQLLHLRLRFHNVALQIIMFLLVAFVLLVSSLCLYDLINGTDYGIQDMLYTSKLKYGFMSPITATLFIVLSIAMLLSSILKRFPNLTLLFTSIIFLSAIMSLFGYAIGNNDIFTIKPFRPMSLPTTLCFFALSLSFTFSFRQNSFVRTLLKDDSGGFIARNLLPYVFLIPLVLGYFRYIGEREGLYDTGFGIAITVVGSMFTFLILVLRQSYLLSILDRQRNEAENKVQQHASELENAYYELEERNKELEQFSYVSSHDLQELLRKITLQGDMMKAMDYDRLTQPSKERLDKILYSAYRMRTALRDIVRFATLNKETQSEPVDMNKLLYAVQVDLRAVVQEKQAIIKVTGLPTISGVRWQLYQLLYNLIDNAIKFSKEHQPPTINIGCDIVSDTSMLIKHELPLSRKYYHITISDDGIGFKQEMCDKIFIMFQRLHGKNEYPGTGTGLAICRKVVYNHNGDIWAESAPGKGAKFHVLLPEE